MTQRERFETPGGGRWPMVIGAAVLVVCAGAGAWWWTGQSGARATAADGTQLQIIDPAADLAVAAPNTAPKAPAGVAADVAQLLNDADTAFAAADWSTALPLYKQAAVALRGEVQQASGEAKPALNDRLAQVQGRVKVAQAQIDLAQPSAEATSAETRVPHAPAQPGEIRELTIKQLGNFEYDEEVGGLPEDVLALDGATFRLNGYMIPTNQTDRIREFTLVPDAYECCFGEPPGLEHTIHVVLPETKAVTFYYGEIQVTGELDVEEEKKDGYIVNVFTLRNVSSVRATGK